MKKSKILLIIFLLIAVMLGIVVGSQNKEPKKEEAIVQSNEKNNSVDQIEIITEYINIRKSKDITSEILGKVKKGEIYTILESNETSQYKWIKIKTKNGIEGYVSGQEGYVKIIKSENKSSTGEKTELEEKNNQEKEEIKKTEQNNKPTPSKPNPSTTIEQSKPSIITPEPQEPSESISPTPKYISASVEYSCPSPSWEYNSISKTCSLHYANNDYREKRCPTDYEYSGGGCRLTNKKESVSPTTKTTCTNGDSNLEYVGGQYYCRGGSVTTKKVCPSGYTLKSTSVGGMTGYLCMDARALSTQATTVCTNGYTLSTSGYCYKDLEQQATITYSCPTGYTLKEDKCYEN